MTFVQAKDGIAFRLSDDNTLKKKDHIVCRKRITKQVKAQSVETNVMVQIALGSCQRDGPSIMETTKNAIDQIHLITSIKMNIPKNSKALDGYLPKFNTKNRTRLIRSLSLDSKIASNQAPSSQPNSPQSGHTAHTVTTTTSSPLTTLSHNNSFSAPPPFKHTLSCRSLTTPLSLWDALYLENYMEYPLIMIPKIAPSFTSLYETSYQFWFYLQSKRLTTSSFHNYLYEQFKKANISYCGAPIQHVHFESQDRLDGNFPASLDDFINNEKSISIDEPKDPFRFYPDQRSTRDLVSATIIGTLVGGAAMVIKSFVDLLSGDDYAKREEFNKLTHQVDDIRINQLEIKGALNKVISRLEYYDQQISGIISGTTASTLAADIKNYNRYLHTVLSNTLSNYAQAFTSALDNKCSPYALSTVEIQNFATKFHSEKRVTLDTNINKIKTTAVIINQTIFFFFEVPILTDDSLFTFFSIIKVPAFDKNNTFWPEVADSNVAISKDGLKYTILSSIELTRCMDIPSVCRSSYPIIPTASRETCSISTYITSKRTCPLKSSNEIPKPFLYYTGSNLYYSVPFNTTLFISCPEKSNLLVKSGSSIHKSVVISGMGEAIYRPGCTISLESGTYFKTPEKQEIINLENWPLFQLKAALPHSFDHDIITGTPLIPIQILGFTEPSQIEEFDILSKHKDKLNYVLAGFLIFLLFSFLILITICISRKIKSWKVITSNRHNGNEGTYKHNNDDDFQLISIPLTPSANSQQQQQQQQVQEQPEVLDMSLFTREPTRRAAPLHPKFLPKKPPAPMPKSILSQKTVHFNE